jgi:hypothetical protein
VTKRKTQVLAVNLPDGERAIDLARKLADLLGRTVLVVTPDDKEVTLAPRAERQLDLKHGSEPPSPHPAHPPLPARAVRGQGRNP